MVARSRRRFCRLAKKESRAGMLRVRASARARASASFFSAASCARFTSTAACSRAYINTRALSFAPRSLPSLLLSLSLSRPRDYARIQLSEDCIARMRDTARSRDDDSFFRYRESDSRRRQTPTTIRRPPSSSARKVKPRLASRGDPPGDAAAPRNRPPGSRCNDNSIGDGDAASY